MLIIFNDPELADLYEGTGGTKEYRPGSPLVKQFIKTVKKLEAVEKVEQLYQFNSLHYEKLKGDFKNYSSVRINLQYRLIFEEIHDDHEPFSVKVFAIDEISKHY